MSTYTINRGSKQSSSTVFNAEGVEIDASAKGEYVGQIKRNWSSSRNGPGTNNYYEWNGTTWNKLPQQKGLDLWLQSKDAENFESIKEASKAYGGLGGLKIGPLADTKIDNSPATLRYPADMLVDPSSDYVVFEFVKYEPPFGKDARLGGGQYGYNTSLAELEKVAVATKDGEVDSLLLPMPQDLSNEMKQNWEGKSFTGVGRAAIAALAGANFNVAGKQFKDAGNKLKALQAAVTASALNSIPGVGGNLTLNDITGSTRGIVLNPNAELLYDSPDLREIGMTFKMVPRNEAEAVKIRKIVNAFRAASLPTFGSNGADKPTSDDWNDVTFISVPLLCKFTFMTGSSPHKYIAQFKPCAIRQVQVNYTPDGTYATYHGDAHNGEPGAPVATELSLQFLETKLIYAQEIQNGY